MDVSTLNLALPPAGAAPDWVHILPAGSFSGQDGRGPYTLKSAQTVVAASLENGAIPFDENHATETAAIVGGPAPARGWIDQMDVRADGIWAHVEWTAAGRALMEDRGYRWVSPVFTHEKDGAVLQIKSVALTNNPNLIESLKSMQTARHAAAHPNPEDIMDKVAICKALGIPEATADTGVVTALQAVQTELQTARADVTRLKGELETVRTTHVPLAEVTALQTRLATIENDGKKGAATAFVDAAIKEGKPIREDMRDRYIAMHVANPADAEALVNSLPSLHAAGPGTRRSKHDDSDSVEAMSAEDRAVCAKMGIEPTAFIEMRKKQKEAA